MKRAASKGFGEIAVCCDNAAGHVTYIQDAVNQSMADANGVSLAEYIHAIFGLLQQARARRVLLIGCGGGTLATMLRARGVRVTMVDVSETSFVVARRHFNLPKGVACHVADGCAFLRESTLRFDAIVLDAYGRRKIPKQFLTRGFMRLVKSRLRGDNACFIVNVIALRMHDRYVRGVADLMRTTWLDVRVLGSKEGGQHNALAMAGAVSTLKRPTLEMVPCVGVKQLRGSLADLVFRRR